MRTCGGCTRCCDGVLRIEELNVGPAPCPHRIATGCDDYVNRPEHPCKTFQCEWLRVGPKAYPDDMRPDKCGKIFMIQNGEGGKYLITVDTETRHSVSVQLKGKIGFRWEKDSILTAKN